MTRILHTGDTHLGYQQYHRSERREDFRTAFEQVAADAVADDVDAVVHAGDLFHDRRPDLPDLLGVLSASHFPFARGNRIRSKLSKQVLKSDPPLQFSLDLALDLFPLPLSKPLEPAVGVKLDVCHRLPEEVGRLHPKSLRKCLKHRGRWLGLAALVPGNHLF